MINIQYDTFLYIASFLYSINDYRNLMLVNREIYEYLHNRTYREIQLKHEFHKISIRHDMIEAKNEMDMESMSSYLDGWNRYQCINHDCPNKSYNNKSDIDSLAIGISHIYSITPEQYNDYIKDESLDFIEWNKGLRRFIPYCQDCMEKYENTSIQSKSYYTVSISGLAIMLALNL
jgi:hypothetical protein